MKPSCPRQGERERERESLRERDSEREGPRFRVTTVRKCAALRAAGGLVKLQLPRTPPARPGKELLPSSRRKTRKIRNEAHTRGSALPVTHRARLKAEPGPPGGRPPPIRLVLPASPAALRVGPPGILRASMAGTLIPRVDQRETAGTRAAATWGGVGLAPKDSRGAARGRLHP